MTDLEKRKGIFYTRGRFFDTEDEFFSYAKEFCERQTTREDFDVIFDTLKQNVWVNLEIYELQIKNKEFENILQEVFFMIIERIMHKKKGSNG